MRTRPRLSLVAGLAACLILPAGCGGDSTSPKGQTLVVAGPQANIIEAIRSAGFDAKFKQATGASITWIPGQAPDNLTKLIAAKGGKPPFDVAFMDNVEQSRAVDAGVIERLDPSKLTSAAQLPASGFPHPGYGPAWIVIRLGSCVNTAAYQKNGIPIPDGVDGWFEPRLAGRVGLPDPNNFYWPAAMPAIAKHYGVSFDDPQQLIDRFKRVKVQGFYTSSSDAQSSLQSGDVWLTPLTDGRCIGLQLGKQPVTFVPLNLTIDGKKYPYVGLEDVWDIAKGSDNYDLAVKFIDMMLGPDGTLPLTRKFGYIPSRQDLQAQAAQLPDLKAYLAGFSYDQLYFPDYKIFFPHLRDWNDAWNHTFRN